MILIHKYKKNRFDKRKLRTRLNSNYHYFTNVLFHSLIKSGLKHKAFKAFSTAIYNLKLNRYFNKISYGTTLELFENIFTKLESKIYLKSQHVGKTKYIIPLISTRSSISLARRWFLTSLRSRKDRTLQLKLFSEMRDMLNSTSPAINEKNKYYKNAFISKINFRLLKYLIKNVQ